ncbi:MAG: hypothetical protein NTX74_00160 [Flavobacterium sp.]|nr:hypothetical protein [Flavobacterium sp.]
MKSFLRYIGLALLLLLGIAVLLDVVYTEIYSTAKDRWKMEYVLNAPPQDYDVVILGTSRANNHFVPELFEKHGLKTFNFGMSGSHLFEDALLLQLLLDQKNSINYVLLEADLNLSNEKRDEGTTARYLPYLRSNATIRSHYQNQPEFPYWYYLPFYRYMAYESQIGLLELIKTIAHEPSTTLANQGYYPLPAGKKGRMKNDYRALKPLRNRYYEQIKKLCEQHHIHLITVMTPVCENVKGMDYFQKVKSLYPEIYNCEDFVQDDRYFSSCGHLNDLGARLFTQKIIDKFFPKK